MYLFVLIFCGEIFLERTKTGISGLDELIEGGIPKSSSVLVSGGAGSGKTIFAMQYIYNGAKLYKEPGVYVTLETNVKNIVWNMQNFDWDIKKFQDQKLLSVYRLKLSALAEKKDVIEKINEELEIISKMVKEINAKRLVIDSTTAFGVWFNENELRSVLFQFTDSLKDLDCTTLLTAETRGTKSEFSAFGVEEFVTDGVISLHFVPPNRSLIVRKMRGTNHDKSVHPFEIISKEGIKVSPRETILWEAIR